jgi:A/G-specific adenine glycosylase
MPATQRKHRKIPLKLSQQRIRKFKSTVLAYYRSYGRHRLPWRLTRNPYRILISEIMLQQTQVDRVIGKYREFVKRFPTFHSLATAPTSDLLSIWQGLGYNRRALLLKRCATEILLNHNGVLPQDIAVLKKLPGIGNASAAALTAFVYNSPSVLIETNIRTVYFHFFFQTKNRVHDDEIRPIIEQTLDKKNPRRWYYALMDYGAMLKRSGYKLNNKSVHYTKQSAFIGSDRQIRAKIIRMVLKKNSIPTMEIKHQLKVPNIRLNNILQSLIKDNFITINEGKIALR